VASVQERLEAIRDRHPDACTVFPHQNQCVGCGAYWPCPDYWDAHAALAILNFKPLDEDVPREY